MKTVDGDLITLFLASEFDVLIHGCNCFCAMGAGIASQISKRIPEAYMADKLFDKYKTDIDKLSSYSYAFVRRNNGSVGTVINLYTQYQPGMDLDINALFLGFKKLSYKLSSTKKLKIGIPEIGCGIAGGDWTLIGPEIARIMSEFDITRVNYVP